MKEEEGKIELSDFDIKRSEKKRKIKYGSILIGSSILFVLIGTYRMINLVEDFNKPIRENNKEYVFPSFEDFKLLLILVPIISVIKLIVEKSSMPFCYCILSEKYKNENDEANLNLGKIYQKKLATNIFKIFSYIFLTIFGYYVLSQTDYLPWELGGKGYFNKMWEAGNPNTFYHVKPEYFDIYYLTGLSFCVTDFFWLVFVYELQSDFSLMLLHHVCTISLVFFSYITNYSHGGSLVLFIHDIGDIFVYITRTAVNSDNNKYVAICSGISLLIVFCYTRLYLFAKFIYCFYFGSQWKWHFVTTCMYSFCFFLYSMHLNWIFLIFKKILKAIFENKLEDSANFKRYQVKSR